MVRNRRVIGLGLGPCVWVRVGVKLCPGTHPGGSNETRKRLQGFQYVVYFCDTTFNFVSRQLAGPGES